MNHYTTYKVMPCLLAACFAFLYSLTTLLTLGAVYTETKNEAAGLQKKL